MQRDSEMSRDVDIDIGALMRELWKRIWLVVAIPLVVGVALFVLLSGVDPSYRSGARIIIEKRESVFTRRNDGDAALAGGQFDEQAVGSQVEVLTSDDLALKVIAKLNLANHPEFQDGSGRSLTSRLLGWAGAPDDTPELTQGERALTEFRKHLTVYAIDKSRVISVEFWSHDPELAQKVPNALADEYLALTRASQLQTTEEATGWLGTEIEELRRKVREAEQKAAAYRANSDLLMGNNNALLVTQQLSDAASELSRVRDQRSEAESKVAAIRAALDKGGSIEVVPDVIASPLVQRLREREASLQAEISQLEATLLPNHPRLKALTSQVGDYGVQIRNAARDILQSLENNVDLQRKREAVLLTEVNRLKAEAGRVGEAEVELRALEREAAAQRELLETYLSKFREAASRQNRDYLPVDARIISRAVMPSESFFPKIIPFTIAGMVMSMVLTVVAVLAWALLSGRALRDVEQSEPVLPERVAMAQAASRSPVATEGLVDWDDDEDDDYTPSTLMVDDDTSGLPEMDSPSLAPDGEAQFPAASSRANDPENFSFGETFKAIADMDRARIAVVSPGGDEGSLLAWQLVRELAANGREAVIVDLTGSAVTSREFTDADDTPGLRDLMAGRVELSEALHRDWCSSASILPCGSDVEPGPHAMARLGMIADSVVGAFEFVIFDCGVTGPEGLDRIAPRDTLVLVSAEGAELREAAETEAELQEAGFGEAIVVRFDRRDRERLAAIAAA